MKSGVNGVNQLVTGKRWDLTWVWRTLLICFLLPVVIGVAFYLFFTYRQVVAPPLVCPGCTPEQSAHVGLWSRARFTGAVVNLTIALEGIFALVWMAVGLTWWYFRRQKLSPRLAAFALWGGPAAVLETTVMYILFIYLSDFLFPTPLLLY